MDSVHNLPGFMTIQPPDYSTGLFGSKVDYSAPGLFGLWTIRPLDYSALDYTTPGLQIGQYRVRSSTSWLRSHRIPSLFAALGRTIDRRLTSCTTIPYSDFNRPIFLP